MQLKKVKFKGHETFPLREGWVYKCISELDKEDGNRLFSGINPITKLGVGSNMTKAIKYWMKTFNLISDNNMGTALTELGELIKDNDIYLEDVFTIWILHINLCMNAEIATSWYLFFCEFNKKEFSNQEVSDFVVVKIEEKGFSYSKKSIESDAQIITKMYLASNDDRLTPEDNVMCPFSRLGLIKNSGKIYKKCKPNLDNISKYVILYIMSFMFIKNDRISIDSLEEDDFGVSNLLQITRSDLNYYLDELENDGVIQVIRTAGLNTIKLLNDDYRQPNMVIRKYY